MALVSSEPSASATDGRTRLILVAPHGAELPSGFPFPVQTSDTAEQLIRKVVDQLDALSTAPEGEDVPPLVLSLTAKGLEFLTGIATSLGLRIRVLSGLEAEYTGYWSILSAALPNTSINEVMEERAVRDTTDRRPDRSPVKQAKTFEDSLKGLGGNLPGGNALPNSREVAPLQSEEEAD